MGPIMMDVAGTSTTAEDRELLQHPLVGGVILFARNFEQPAQLSALTEQIRLAANRDILIAVDQEGGRVQRFRQGFSEIPAMGSLYRYAQGDIDKAASLARQCGALMAMEVQAANIDISFAPVLDVNGISAVIKERSFHSEPDQVTRLASAFIQGMHSVGMKSTGKHFPGHGSVEADSHIDMPIDHRSWGAITAHDIKPFKALIDNKQLDAVMPAHVIYPEVDNKSVGFSSIWLQQVLRNQYGFKGVIFSDDLSMHGASSIGGYIERAEAAQQAGCDMLLLCNNRDACITVIDQANIAIDADSSARLSKMLKPSVTTWQDMQSQPLWRQLNQQVSTIKEHL